MAAYPALVGATATDASAEPAEEEDVEDGELRAVCERAVANYLAGERRDLAADLTDGAVVSLPARRLAVRSIDGVTWVRRGRRVAVVGRRPRTRPRTCGPCATSSGSSGAGAGSCARSQSIRPPKEAPR